MRVEMYKHKFDEYDRIRLDENVTAVLQTAFISNSELLRELQKALPWTQHKCPIEQSLRNAIKKILDDDNDECPLHC